MLITISGMVGAGKSTTATAVVRLLAERGLEAKYHRFRFLRPFGVGRDSNRPRLRPTTERGQQGASGTTSRGSGFRLRRLTAPLAVGYAGRILAFRTSGVGSGPICDVLDRYFYDNLVHYGLNSRAERLYARQLRWLIPVPDLALLVLASDRTLSSRRVNYAPEYLTTVAKRYCDLPNLFPNLIPIRTDPGGAAEEEIRNAVLALVARDGRP